MKKPLLLAIIWSMILLSCTLPFQISINTGNEPGSDRDEPDRQANAPEPKDKGAVIPASEIDFSMRIGIGGYLYPDIEFGEEAILAATRELDQLGLVWLRHPGRGISWYEVQPTRDTWDFSKLDAVVEEPEKVAAAAPEPPAAPPEPTADPAREPAALPPPDALIATATGDYEYVDLVNSSIEGVFADRGFVVVDWPSAPARSMHEVAGLHCVTTAKFTGASLLRYHGRVTEQFTVTCDAGNISDKYAYNETGDNPDLSSGEFNPADCDGSEAGGEVCCNQPREEGVLVIENHLAERCA